MQHYGRVEPEDVHNRALVSNVHPVDWQNPEPAPRYNLVVIGAGTAGLIAANVAASLGARVALIERHLMGGDCLNVGCVPSKTLIRASRLAAETRRAHELGMPLADGARIDFGAAMERVREIRARISQEDSARRYQREIGADVFLGEARFTGPDTVQVEGRTLRFKRAVIATGARPAVPPIPGIEQVDCLSNETVFSLTALPERLAVIGGGPIGCELAQAFARLGSQVTILSDAPHLLPREDGDAAEVVQEALLHDGVRLVLDCHIDSAERRGEERVLGVTRGEGGSEEIAADQILLGAGRRPNVEGLGLETAGIAYHPKGGVAVNDHLQTTNARVYASGDVCMEQKFTHAADAASKLVVQNALFFGRKRLSSLIVPWCTYTDPEVAHVGISEREAEERGLALDTYKVDLARVNRAVCDGEEQGFFKIHVRRGGQRILGATIVASHAGEMIGELTLALQKKIGLGALTHVIHPYPTQAEGIKAAAGARTRARLTPFAKGLFERFLAWRR